MIISFGLQVLMIISFGLQVLMIMRAIEGEEAFLRLRTCA
jgi:hypothetical protein